MNIAPSNRVFYLRGFNHRQTSFFGYLTDIMFNLKIMYFRERERR